MGLFNFLHTPDINSGVTEFQHTDGAVLLDVRTPDEYRGGHIEGSINVPLDRLTAVENTVQNKNTPLFVYCLSGGRSGRAASLLRQMNYQNVTNIGGISAYRGKVVR